jgi:glutaredoxin
MLTVYTKGSCPDCYKAKFLLDQAKVPYKESVIGIHIMRESFLKLFPEVKAVPLIVEQHSDGFTEIIGSYKELQTYLGENGPPVGLAQG